MNQSENIISWLGDKSRWNKQRNKQFLKVQEKNTGTRNTGYHQSITSFNYRKRRGKRVTGQWERTDY